MDGVGCRWNGTVWMDEAGCRWDGTVYGWMRQFAGGMGHFVDG